MKKTLIPAALLTLAFSTLSVAAENSQSGTLRFNKKMVAGKSMVSSGYPGGTIKFNSDGTLTCTNYPKVVSCLTWKIDNSGLLHRDFLDTRNVPAFTVKAVWKLTVKKGNELQVDQTSNNSPAVTPLTVTIQ